MADSDKEKALNDEGTEESSKSKNKNPYFDTSSSDSDFEYEFTCEICNKTFSGLKPLRQHERGAQHLKRVRKREIEKKLVGNLEEDDSAEKDLEDDMEQTLFAVCKTCKKEFMGPESLQLHLKSSAHKKKMAAAKLLKEIRDEDGHVSLEKLRQKRQEKKSKKEVPIVVGRTSGHLPRAENPGETGGACGYSGPPISSDDSSDDDKAAEAHEFECLDCQKVFSGINPWYQHLVSKVHEKTLKQKELFDKLRIADASLSKESSSHQYLVQEDDDVISCGLCNVALSGPESASAHLKSRRHAKNLELKQWKKSMKESKEGGKRSSKVKKRAYSESSVQNNSEAQDPNAHSHSIEARVQETTGREIDPQEHKRGFSTSEELSFVHEKFKSSSESTSSPAVEKESSNAPGDGLGVRKTTNQEVTSCDEFQKKFQASCTVSQEKSNVQSFQETYI